MSRAITAAAIRENMLDPAMEARARNLEQYDPSPETDSLLEHLRATAMRLPNCRVRQDLMGLIDGAIDSNVLEGTEELLITGTADQLVTDLTDRQLNAPVAELGAKAIARRLRQPLEVLRSPAGHTPTDLIRASRTVRDAIEQVPRLQLLCPAVQHELGERKYAVLAIVDLAVRP